MMFRLVLCILILVSQSAAVQAAAGDCRDPLWRQLSAITRYCVIIAGRQNATMNGCEYDCLISKETIATPANGVCPITVKQRLFNDNTKEIVAN